MDWIILIVGCVAMFCGGFMIGSRVEEGRQNTIRQDDAYRAQRCIKEAYERGYDEGTRKAVSLVREVFGVDLKGNENDEHRLENT